MDEFEKLALRRWKPVFQESVEVNSELLKDLQDRGLLNDVAMEQLKSEKNINQRASKLIDCLLEAKIEHTFLEICNALVHKYPALSKDLQTEVRIERGDVIIDDDVMKQAATLVHRKFGSNRRFAEVDKKDMTDLIAIKIQLSKEEWKQEIDQIREELDRSIVLCKTKDMAAKELDETIIRFIKKHEDELVSKAHDMTTTTELILSSVEDSDFHGKLKRRLRFLLQRAERVVEERELIMREREKAQRSLADVNQRVASNNASAARADSDKVKKEINSKESLINRLRRINDSLEKESENSEKAIEELTEANMKQTKMIAKLEAKIAELESAKPAAPKEEVALALAPPVEKPRTNVSPSRSSTGSLSIKGTAARQPTSATSRKQGGGTTRR